MKPYSRILLLMVICTSFSVLSHAAGLECTNWQQNHSEWIWCDDFENDASLETDYFEVNRSNGFGVSDDSSMGGKSALKSTYTTDKKEFGNVKLSFGRTRVGASKSRNAETDFEDVYWRIYLRMPENWEGNGGKLTRAISFSNSDWSQAMKANVWQDSWTSHGIGLDPTTGVDGSQVVTVGYNDFSNTTYLGKANASTQIYSGDRLGKWQCIETHVRLNTLGETDGVFQIWIDGRLEAEKTSLNWRGSYSGYAINAIFLENYHNKYGPKTQSRYMDNFVVSRSRIGCLNSPPKAPSNISAY
ncbi:MAG: hypothetical protein KUG76_07740 [Gammaproteobacteria bacterium]|nr:hypothetical protein [Gammaproteobacteria bacterium]